MEDEIALILILQRRKSFIYFVHYLPGFPPTPYNDISRISYPTSELSNAIQAFCANGHRLLVINCMLDLFAACSAVCFNDFDDDDMIYRLMMAGGGGS